MSITHKIAEWQRAGLLSAEAAAAILQHEERQNRPYLLYAAGGLGALTIVLGVVAIIASNWQDIPGGVKLAIDLLLASGVAAAIVLVERRGGAWLRELLISIYYGFVLASIGLISQVYHLGGATWQALLAWSALTFVLVTRGRSAGLASAWIIGLHTTYYLGLEALVDGLGSGREGEALGVGLVSLPPLLCLIVAASASVARWRPLYSRAFARFGWSGALLLASAATFVLYDDRSTAPPGQLLLGAGIAAALTGVLVVRASKLVPGRPSAIAPTRALLLLILVLGYGPLLLASDEQRLLAALCFIALWAAAAWVGYAAHNVRVLNIATAVIGVRLITVYFEVFGSLLDTGLGLITGGLFTVGLTYLWARKRRDFAAHLAEEPQQ